jgi:hypothetical protein
MDNNSATFIDCPAYMDEHGAVRCGLPAEILCRYTMTSTDGPLESARIQCPRQHWFNGPIEFLTWKKHPSPTTKDRPVPTSGARPRVTGTP